MEMIDDQICIEFKIIVHTNEEETKKYICTYAQADVAMSAKLTLLLFRDPFFCNNYY